jgi:lysozyme family protein
MEEQEMTRFNECFTRLLGNEGGYVNNPKDPGGETNWGISKRSYPTLDIKNLTQDDAKAIYKRDFWDKCRCDDLPVELDFALFDCAVNSGVKQAIILLQRALGVTEDGVFGKMTEHAVSKFYPDTITARYLGCRLRFMTELRPWDTFAKGWARRIAEQLVSL